MIVMMRILVFKINLMVGCLSYAYIQVLYPY